MENKVRLSLVGLSYNPLQDGAFAMLLAAEGTTKRIPIIIGAPEAQAIAIVMENIKPQRPMTHDLFATMTHAFGVVLQEVFIYNFEDGIFSAEMTFSDGDRQITLDSRTSDAVAIAIRTGAPIFTTPAILEETGVEFVEVQENEDETSTRMNEGDSSSNSIDEEMSEYDSSADYANMSLDELNEAFENAIASDNFEEAAIIRQILDARQSEEQP